VVALALRLASTFTLSAHRRALRVLASAAVVIVASELVGISAALTGQSTFTEAVEELVELVAILAVAAVLRYMGRAEREEIASLRHFADVDGLTGLSSRSFFDRAAARRVERCRSSGMPLACLMLDVDDFKSYNDSHGHAAGDEILRCVGRALRECARADDLVSRYGGEEFVVLAQGEMEGAIELAERIRRKVEEGCLPKDEHYPLRPVTVSVGVAPFVGNEMRSLERLVLVADAQMYEAKTAGKNRVSVFGDQRIPGSA
jgi:diguanylate cyclase (GGDEF)-like protein